MKENEIPKKKKRRMTAKQLANLRPFQKGNNANPLGAAAHNPIRKITHEIFKDIVELALTSNIEALQAIVKDPKTPSIKVGVATSLVTAIKRGDWQTLERIIERLVGKVTVTIDHTTMGQKIESPSSIIVLPAKKTLDDIK